MHVQPSQTWGWSGRVRLVLIAIAVAVLVGGGVAWAASAKKTATCTSSPVVTSGADSDSFTVKCSVPRTTVTETQTVTVTSTASPTSVTPTTTPPTTTPTTTTPPTTEPPTTGFPTEASTGPRTTPVLGGNTACGTVTNRLVMGDLTLTCDTTMTDSRIIGRVLSNGFKLTGSYLDIGPDSCPARASDYRLVQGPVALDHTHIHNNSEDLVRLYGVSVTIRDSLLDRTCFYAGAHLDAIQFYGPGERGTAVIDHNTIDVDPVNNGGAGGNSALFLADNPGRGTTITVTNNRLKGGNYTVAAYDAYAGSGVVYDIRGNTFVRGAQFGPCATNSAAYDGTSGLRFTGNVYDDGTALGSC